VSDLEVSPSALTELAGNQVMSTKKRTKQNNARPADTVLTLAQEELQVAKREVVTGRVRVRTVTDTGEEIIRQELLGERVEVQRVPADTLIELGAQPPQVRTEGNVTIIPVLEEVLIVEKRLLLKEELHIIRHSTAALTETPVTVRKQRAVVEQLDSEGIAADPEAKL
jgi:stress response protein YsnF